MSKRQAIMLLGVWVLVLPFLGFPGSWERFLGFVTGLVIIAVAYLMKPPAAAGKTGPDRPYEEHASQESGPSSPAGSPAEDHLQIR
ncbi:MAG: hypothetical protein KGI69_03300 [Patescibacteria group bacterium]|nr:hypothetical protein [Patescibacteria group bacterium]